MPKTYSRPGVEAAARLANLDQDPETWEKVESQYNEMIAEKGQDLVALDESCELLGERLRSTAEPSISKKDLLEVVKWKFAKGKPRYALMKHLNANVESDVERRSKAGFTLAKNDDIRGAISEISGLKGVGPATASAILSLYRPDLFSFMDDEIIECLHEGKRDYTLPIYIKVNDKCKTLAESLGEGWTPRRVGKALWTAARVLASGGNDLTTVEPKDHSTKRKSTSDQVKVESKKVVNRKRQKK